MSLHECTVIGKEADPDTIATKATKAVDRPAAELKSLCMKAAFFYPAAVFALSCRGVFIVIDAD